MDDFRSTKNAFTLIEIIIVITILITLTGFITANYVRYSEEKKLNEAIIHLKTILNIARTKAIAGDISTFACSNFQGYQVKYDATASNYKMNICCSDLVDNDCSALTYTTATYAVKTNILVRTTDFNVIFYPFAKGTNLSDVTGVELKNTAINQCNFVKVSPIGVIEMGAPYEC